MLLRDPSSLRPRLLLVPVTLLVAVVSAALPPGALESPNASAERARNLHAFARLYGYVRFFHPSDEAASLDWDRFAVLGVRRIRNAPSSAELPSLLEELFRPVAPSMVLYEEGSTPPGPRHLPDDTLGLTTVAWQHQGVLVDPSRANTYWSRRTGRTAEMTAGRAPGLFSRSLDAVPFRGRRVRLRASVRAVAQGAGNQAQIFLRVNREGGDLGFYDDMADRPIDSSSWRRYEIVGSVADDAERLIFGGIARGLGTFAFDAFELAVEEADGSWTPLPLRNHGFEGAADWLERKVDDTGERDVWRTTPGPYDYEISGDAAEGNKALRVRTVTVIRDEPLFDGTPIPGEVLDLDLGSSLTVRLPVSLYDDGDGTFPRADGTALRHLEADLATIDLGRLTGEDLDTRLADVVIAWNVLQHFYPYFDLVESAWLPELDRGLERALEDDTGEEFMQTLRAMVVRLGDGHGRVLHPSHTPRGGLPWRLEWIEGRVVVTASEAPGVRRGDVVVTVDGASISELVREEERQVSGSPQWKKVQALRAMGAGDPGSSVTVGLRRAGDLVEVRATREWSRTIPEFERPPVQRIESGVWYVDLDRASWPSLEGVLDSLAVADGVVFDLRGYPAGNHAILRHLLEEPDTTEWMWTPRILYPDQSRVTGYRRSGWGLEPAEPHIGGRVAFITDGRAISYAESVMGYVDHYDLGEIVGAPTAGANGNVNPIILPGGFTVSWTGMRVVRQDGSRLHGLGIPPTVPAFRTLAGVREGRDELLERAVALVR